MTMETKITLLRSMLDSDDDDPTDVLEAYLELAGQKILNHMYQFATPEEYKGLQVPDKYAMIQIQVGAYLLNRRGAEGEIQHIENGIHRNYGSADVPDQMLKDITPFCRVVV